jgi:hypothetical protein
MAAASSLSMPAPNPAAPPDVARGPGVLCVGVGARAPFFFRLCARARVPPEEWS